MEIYGKKCIEFISPHGQRASRTKCFDQFSKLKRPAAVSAFSCLILCLLSSSVVRAEAITDPTSLSLLIDQRISARWKAENVTPAPVADDAEFMRRVYLDVTGKIPHASSVRDFLADDSLNKRQQLVEGLLASPSYIIHYTNLWRAAMIPEADADQQIRVALPGFESWLRSRVAENRNFAEIVEEMLTLPFDQQAMLGLNQLNQSTPVAFYQAKEAKPERLAAATSRLFLGIRLDCAQCHDHPFDSWKQDQFWKYAAFFTDIPAAQVRGQEVVTRKESPGTIKIPELDRVVEATFLDRETAISEGESRDRTVLAKWIVSSENPYFAKAAVNRIWSYHFGIGLVEPMDDFSSSNPASHPELLDDLAEAFVANDFDFKFLIRAITSSKTYQLSSRQTDSSQEEPTLFARMPVRGMTAEQIFDSLSVATGYRQPFDPEQPLNFNNDQARQDFIAMFGNQTESAPDRASTVLQALALMNGDFVGDATDIVESRTLAAIIDSPFLSDEQRVEAMYLSTLSRFPSKIERQEMLDYIKSNQADGSRPESYADIFWVLLNSSEFLLNH
ncbi:DUF1549 and DUF1553 domain-containing protein [Thalassoglobus polymorphus]|uniref:DUF1553 domain-containing protein n=1 Tax=Thalassoglobus polymorphus TaxID=2527994 RepID=A0A517QJE0_9PLAN|nr:DUF1549 and DUF1553 domain-containing protein [Thalassoglobus polymorphus]QDT31714.1 hypothetical protein Mal48_09490 [Thalassoglobus polymorphus]